jgi:hypothetical protein
LQYLQALAYLLFLSEVVRDEIHQDLESAHIELQ